MPRQLQSDDYTFEVKETELDDVQDADPQVVYVLRELTTKKWRELNKTHSRKMPNKATKRMEDVVDQEAFADAIVDYVLVDWRGIVERGGNPAPCTTENKHRLDGVLKAALVGRAGLSQIVQASEARDASFRPTEDLG
jgi:NAD-dependent oxidoreductase involved in siderophore biosynthesis